MKSGVFEAQRLLRRIQERDPECARWLIQAIEQLATADANMPIKYALLQIHIALPAAALNNRDKELLCQKSSESSTADQPSSSTKASHLMSV